MYITMNAGQGRVPFICAGVVHRIFHPLRCVAEFTHANKENTKAGTLQHRKTERFMDLILNQGKGPL